MSAARQGGATHSVTLITGDVVRVMDLGQGRQAVDVTRPAGAPGGVRTENVGKDLYVFPDEAMPFLAAGALDRRLFDVTSLVAQGYDDAHSDGIPLIVGYDAAAPRSGAAAGAGRAPKGSVMVRTLPSINGAALKVAKKQTRSSWETVAASAGAAAATAAARPTGARLSGGIDRIWLDGKVHASLATSTARIGALGAWAAGLDGKGVKVAVLDTGIDRGHPDLNGRVSQSESFVPGEGVDDGNGHGTHTASTVGGSGAASDGREKGVAPGSDLLIGKVLGDDGSGDDSWVIAGMEWAAAQHAKVVSMSLGGSDPSDGTDPLSLAVDRLSAESGTLFVVAAGNAGQEAVMGAPGAADAALTVAAVDDEDRLASFSTMGPRQGDYALKPDIAAPGVDILAAKAGGTAASGYYQAMSGTSMATPHVAGAAAILAQQHPDWTGSRLKDALMSTSAPLAGATAYQVGAGRVDLTSSVASTVTGTGSVWFGFDAWPHTDEPAVSRTVTYRNDGGTDLVLRLAESAAVAGGPYDVDPGADAGAAAPAGMFSLSADTVTVPAHGTASVTTTAEPRLGANGRRYLGQVTATDASGAVVARTQLGLYKEDQRHTLHISLKDRAGKPAAGTVELQTFGVPDPSFVAVDATGTADVRLPAGTYSAVSYLPVAGSHGPDSVGLALLGDPEIVLDRDRSIDLDASRAVEATAQVPQEIEDRMVYADWYRSDGAGSTIAEQYILSPTDDSLFVLPTRAVTRGAFEYETRWRKAAPQLTVSRDGRPVTLQYQAGSAVYDGTARLEAVHAGTGTPADYARHRVKGRIAVVTASPALTGSQRARAAADAGAALLIVVDDGPGKLYEWVGTETGTESAVPVVSVTAREGAPLLAAADRGRAELALKGVRNSPYVYDLVDPRPDRIPADLTYRPKAEDLASVRMRFHGDTTYSSGEYRWDYRPYRAYSVGFLQPVDMPGTRIDYVSAQPGTTWAEDSLTGPGMVLESRSGMVTYRPHTETTRDWYAPVAHPRNGSGFWWSSRQSGYAEINIQPWTDSGTDHGGIMVDDANTVTLKAYQDGELVKTSAWPSLYLDTVPDRPVTYTLDLKAERDPALYRLTPRTHSMWTVRSAPVTDPYEIDVMALLQLDYQLSTDLAGNRPGGRQTVGLSASHLPGAAGTGAVTDGTLAVSYDDGATWHPAALERTATGHWTARFDAPSRGFVSLRATARDSAGNRVTQEVIRAYGLSGPEHHGRAEP
ncbi:S8 family serine peptidase [Kitasatospora sp. NPDC007106]|uniref:S8 family serine peptidase n=1 Tax=Kitasatospora sp. NPDC007106 TaxID=3156914 RepID=UPI0033EB430F